MRNSADHATPIPCSKELDNIHSLAALRRIERVPPHSWDEDERELLTILYRWYDSANPATLPQTFNAITGLELRPYIIRTQFENHILLYGGHAFPEYARVMSIPFHDPEGRYDNIRGIIEETAMQAGIDLSRREVEVSFHSGAARYAKSPKTRRLYRSLVRRAAEKGKERARGARRMDKFVSTPSTPPLSRRNRPLGRTALLVGSDDETEENWSDVEDLNPGAGIPNGLRPLIEPIKRNIAFRVWDENSRTKFSEKAGFVSQAFSIWRGEYPPPFSSDGQGREALMLLTNLRRCLEKVYIKNTLIMLDLSLKGGASTFISLSTSLLQALVKASSMNDPKIAVSK
jgi:hypothetical protein